jgi:hypothetical protein
MNTNTTGSRAGVEWVGEPERDARGWPILHPADPCDGKNPVTGRDCVNGYHNGYHRDTTGAEWLDEE